MTRFQRLIAVVCLVAAAIALTVWISPITTAHDNESHGQWVFDGDYLLNSSTGELWYLNGRIKHPVTDYVPK